MSLFGKPARPVTPPPAATPPAPAGLTKDDLAAALTGALGPIKSELESKIAELRGTVAGLAGREPTVVMQPAAPYVPPEPVISDDDIEQAIRAGEGAAPRIRAMVDRAVNQAAAGLKQQLDAFQEAGLESLGAVASEIAVGKMRHYKRFQKEIDARVARLEPTLRANPQAIQMIHNSVVGEHQEELEREAVEAAIRGAQDGGQGTTEREIRQVGGTTPGTGLAPASSRQEKKHPSAEELAGSDGMEALKHKDRGAGKDQDSFAQSMGYHSWDHYMEAFEQAKEDGERMGIATR